MSAQQREVRLSTLLFIAVQVVAFSVPSSVRAQTRPESVRVRLADADSVRLQRVAGGFGGPAYEVVVTRTDGLVVRPRSAARRLFRVVSVRPGAFSHLMALADVVDFVQLPDTIEQHPVFGRVCGVTPPAR